MLNISESALKRIVNGKIALSYNMYTKFKSLGVFDDLIEINYSNIPSNLSKWKKRMNYTNKQCAEVLEVSEATYKRLVSGKRTPSQKTYLKLKQLNLI